MGLPVAKGSPAREADLPIPCPEILQRLVYPSVMKSVTENPHDRLYSLAIVAVTDFASDENSFEAPALDEKAMLSFRAKITFIIPTVNRSRELRRLLASIESQSVLPDEVIVVDGSPEPIQPV